MDEAVGTIEVVAVERVGIRENEGTNHELIKDGKEVIGLMFLKKTDELVLVDRNENPPSGIEN